MLSNLQSYAIKYFWWETQFYLRPFDHRADESKNGIFQFSFFLPIFLSTNFFKFYVLEKNISKISGKMAKSQI